ncbi:polymer-forming cytoskeletal protein [Cohnella pontilimi]|uniref:Polymer-forming cytoskeletal protein n=1 Tax=Cohnella pontilimi TaxID=2564100 RepID=A0A4U0FBT3_9BACL|nr:polymer-forming cytoskeletal protein [Cohnella pontilimi]TJY42180.1 polymer-forming cytoskeletal protein [Cohnella pontilimi]
MFKKQKVKIDPNMTDTLIGEGTQFEGKIRSAAGIRIEGQLTGDIECTGDVTIGENGVARSNIRARNVILAGHVTGNVTATGNLTIKASGNLNGNLTAQELSIESGGVFQGSSKMDYQRESTADEAKALAAAAKETELLTASDDSNSMLKTW